MAFSSLGLSSAGLELPFGPIHLFLGMTHRGPRRYNAEPGWQASGPVDVGTCGDGWMSRTVGVDLGTEALRGVVLESVKGRMDTRQFGETILPARRRFDDRGRSSPASS